LKTVAFSVCTASEVPSGGRFHGKQRDNLKQVVLDDVSQAASGFVKRAARSHPEAFGQGDLNAGHVVSIPDRFKERIGKSGSKGCS